MGRKTRRRVPTRPKPTIPDIFECPNCNEQSVHVEIDRKAKTAVVECGTCHIRNLISIKSIDEKIDAYGSFIDSWYQKYEPEIEDAQMPAEENPNEVNSKEKDSEAENEDEPASNRGIDEK
ncbi:MAG: hypothetical protein ACFFD4_04645 [Candidatus Odinarchaeota archaeon]